MSGGIRSVFPRPSQRGAAAWIGALALTALSPADAVTKSATLDLLAEVLPACSAGSASPAGLVFGTFDLGTFFALDNAVSTASQPNAGSLRINCISGTSYRVLISAGSSGSVNQRTLAGPSGATVRYNLYTTGSHAQIWDSVTGVSGTGNGQDQWLPLYVHVPAQPTPAAGVYADTLTVTVSW